MRFNNFYRHAFNFLISNGIYKFRDDFQFGSKLQVYFQIESHHEKVHKEEFKKMAFTHKLKAIAKKIM